MYSIKNLWTFILIRNKTVFFCFAISYFFPNFIGFLNKNLYFETSTRDCRSSLFHSSWLLAIQELSVGRHHCLTPQLRNHFVESRSVLTISFLCRLKLWSFSPPGTTWKWRNGLSQVGFVTGLEQAQLDVDWWWWWWFWNRAQNMHVFMERPHKKIAYYDKMSI